MQELLLMIGIILALVGFVLLQSNLVHVHSVNHKGEAKNQSRLSKRMGADALIVGGSMILFTWLDLFSRNWDTKDTGIGIAICTVIIGIVEFRRRNA
jgi:dipeptide/tripeptide permease